MFFALYCDRRMLSSLLRTLRNDEIKDKKSLNRKLSVLCDKIDIEIEDSESRRTRYIHDNDLHWSSILMLT